MAALMRWERGAGVVAVRCGVTKLRGVWGGACAAEREVLRACRKNTKTHNSTAERHGGAAYGGGNWERQVMQRRNGGAGNCLRGADAAPAMTAWPQPAADMRLGRAARQATRNEWRVKEQRVE